jgi:hypothetical protein
MEKNGYNFYKHIFLSVSSVESDVTITVYTSVIVFYNTRGKIIVRKRGMFIFGKFQAVAAASVINLTKP